MPYNITCAVCGKQFIGRRSNDKTCSQECHKEYKRTCCKRYFQAQQHKSAQLEDYTRQYQQREREFDLKLLAAEKAGLSYGKYVLAQKIASQVNPETQSSKTGHKEKPAKHHTNLY